MLSSCSQPLPHSGTLPRSTGTIPCDAHSSPAHFANCAPPQVVNLLLRNVRNSSTSALHRTKVHVRQRWFSLQTLAFTLRTHDFQHAFFVAKCFPATVKYQSYF